MTTVLKHNTTKTCTVNKKSGVKAKNSTLPISKGRKVLQNTKMDNAKLEDNKTLLTTADIKLKGEIIENMSTEEKQTDSLIIDVVDKIPLLIESCENTKIDNPTQPDVSKGEKLSIDDKTDMKNESQSRSSVLEHTVKPKSVLKILDTKKEAIGLKQTKGVMKRSPTYTKTLNKPNSDTKTSALNDKNRRLSVSSKDSTSDRNSRSRSGTPLSSSSTSSSSNRSNSSKPFQDNKSKQSISVNKEIKNASQLKSSKLSMVSKDSSQKTVTKSRTPNTIKSKEITNNKHIISKTVLNNDNKSSELRRSRSRSTTPGSMSVSSSSESSTGSKTTSVSSGRSVGVIKVAKHVTSEKVKNNDDKTEVDRSLKTTNKVSSIPKSADKAAKQWVSKVKDKSYMKLTASSINRNPQSKDKVIEQKSIQTSAKVKPMTSRSNTPKPDNSTDLKKSSSQKTDINPTSLKIKTHDIRRDKSRSATPDKSLPSGNSKTMTEANEKTNTFSKQTVSQKSVLTKQSTTYKAIPRDKTFIKNSDKTDKTSDATIKKSKYEVKINTSQTCSSLEPKKQSNLSQSNKQCTSERTQPLSKSAKGAIPRSNSPFNGESLCTNADKMSKSAESVTNLMPKMKQKDKNTSSMKVNNAVKDTKIVKQSSSQNSRSTRSDSENKSNHGSGKSAQSASAALAESKKHSISHNKPSMKSVYTSACDSSTIKNATQEISKSNCTAKQEQKSKLIAPLAKNVTDRLSKVSKPTPSLLSNKSENVSKLMPGKSGLTLNKSYMSTNKHSKMSSNWEKVKLKTITDSKITVNKACNNTKSIGNAHVSNKKLTEINKTKQSKLPKSENGFNSFPSNTKLKTSQKLDQNMHNKQCENQFQSSNNCQFQDTHVQPAGKTDISLKDQQDPERQCEDKLCENSDRKQSLDNTKNCCSLNENICVSMETDSTVSRMCNVQQQSLHSDKNNDLNSNFSDKSISLSPKNEESSIDERIRNMDYTLGEGFMCENETHNLHNSIRVDSECENHDNKCQSSETVKTDLNSMTKQDSTCENSEYDNVCLKKKGNSCSHVPSAVETDSITPILYTPSESAGCSSDASTTGDIINIDRQKINDTNFGITICPQNNMNKYEENVMSIYCRCSCYGKSRELLNNCTGSKKDINSENKRSENIYEKCKICDKSIFSELEQGCDKGSVLLELTQSQENIEIGIKQSDKNALECQIDKPSICSDSVMNKIYSLHTNCLRNSGETDGCVCKIESDGDDKIHLNLACSTGAFIDQNKNENKTQNETVLSHKDSSLSEDDLPDAAVSNESIFEFIGNKNSNVRQSEFDDSSQLDLNFDSNLKQTNENVVLDTAQKSTIDLKNKSERTDEQRHFECIDTRQEPIDLKHLNDEESLLSDWHNNEILDSTKEGEDKQLQQVLIEEINKVGNIKITSVEREDTLFSTDVLCPSVMDSLNDNKSQKLDDGLRTNECNTSNTVIDSNRNLIETMSLNTNSDTFECENNGYITNDDERKEETNRVLGLENSYTDTLSNENFTNGVQGDKMHSQLQTPGTNSVKVINPTIDGELLSLSGAENFTQVGSNLDPTCCSNINHNTVTCDCASTEIQSISVGNNSENEDLSRKHDIENDLIISNSLKGHNCDQNGGIHEAKVNNFDILNSEHHSISDNINKDNYVSSNQDDTNDSCTTTCNVNTKLVSTTDIQAENQCPCSSESAEITSCNSETLLFNNCSQTDQTNAQTSLLSCDISKSLEHHDKACTYGSDNQTQLDTTNLIHERTPHEQNTYSMEHSSLPVKFTCVQSISNKNSNSPEKLRENILSTDCSQYDQLNQINKDCNLINPSEVIKHQQFNDAATLNQKAPMDDPDQNTATRDLSCDLPCVQTETPVTCFMNSPELATSKTSKTFNPTKNQDVFEDQISGLSPVKITTEQNSCNQQFTENSSQPNGFMLRHIEPQNFKGYEKHLTCIDHTDISNFSLEVETNSGIYEKERDAEINFDFNLENSCNTKVTTDHCSEKSLLNVECIQPSSPTHKIENNVNHFEAGNTTAEGVCDKLSFNNGTLNEGGDKDDSSCLENIKNDSGHCQQSLAITNSQKGSVFKTCGLNHDNRDFRTETDGILKDKLFEVKLSPRTCREEHHSEELVGLEQDINIDSDIVDVSRKSDSVTPSDKDVPDDINFAIKTENSLCDADASNVSTARVSDGPSDNIFSNDKTEVSIAYKGVTSPKSPDQRFIKKHEPGNLHQSDEAKIGEINCEIESIEIKPECCSDLIVSICSNSSVENNSGILIDAGEALCDNSSIVFVSEIYDDICDDFVDAEESLNSDIDIDVSRKKSRGSLSETGLYISADHDTSVESFQDAVESLDDDYLVSTISTCIPCEDEDTLSQVSLSFSDTSTDVDASLENLVGWEEFSDDIDFNTANNDTMESQRAHKTVVSTSSSKHVHVSQNRTTSVLKDNIYLQTASSARNKDRQSEIKRNVLKCTDIKNESGNEAIKNVIYQTRDGRLPDKINIQSSTGEAGSLHGTASKYSSTELSDVQHENTNIQERHVTSSGDKMKTENKEQSTVLNGECRIENASQNSVSRGSNKRLISTNQKQSNGTKPKTSDNFRKNKEHRTLNVHDIAFSINQGLNSSKQPPLNIGVFNVGTKIETALNIRTEKRRRRQIQQKSIENLENNLTNLNSKDITEENEISAHSDAVAECTDVIDNKSQDNIFIYKHLNTTSGNSSIIISDSNTETCSNETTSVCIDISKKSNEFSEINESNTTPCSFETETCESQGELSVDKDDQNAINGDYCLEDTCEKDNQENVIDVIEQQETCTSETIILTTEIHESPKCEQVDEHDQLSETKSEVCDVMSENTFTISINHDIKPSEPDLDDIQFIDDDDSVIADLQDDGDVTSYSVPSETNMVDASDNISCNNTNAASPNATFTVTFDLPSDEENHEDIGIVVKGDDKNGVYVEDHSKQSNSTECTCDTVNSYDEDKITLNIIPKISNVGNINFEIDSNSNQTCINTSESSETDQVLKTDDVVKDILVTIDIAKVESVKESNTNSTSITDIMETSNDYEKNENQTDSTNAITNKQDVCPSIEKSDSTEIIEESNISVAQALLLEKQKLDNQNSEPSKPLSRRGSRTSSQDTNLLQINAETTDDDNKTELCVKKPIKKSSSFRLDRESSYPNNTKEEIEQTETYMNKKVSDICRSFLTKTRKSARKTQDNTPTDSPTPQRKLMQWVNDHGKWVRKAVTTDYETINDIQPEMQRSTPNFEENQSEITALRKSKSANDALTTTVNEISEVCVKADEAHHKKAKNTTLVSEIQNDVSAYETDPNKNGTTHLVTHKQECVPPVSVECNKICYQYTVSSECVEVSNKLPELETITQMPLVSAETSLTKTEFKTNNTPNEVVCDSDNKESIVNTSATDPTDPLLLEQHTLINQDIPKIECQTLDSSTRIDLMSKQHVDESQINISEPSNKYCDKLVKAVITDHHDALKDKTQLPEMTKPLDNEMPELTATEPNEKIISNQENKEESVIENDKINITESVSVTQFKQKDFLFGLQDNFNRRKPRKLLPEEFRKITKGNVAKPILKQPQTGSDSPKTESSQPISIPKIKCVKIQEEIFEGSPDYMKDCNRNPLNFESDIKKTVNNTHKMSIHSKEIPKAPLRKSKTFSGFKKDEIQSPTTLFYIGESTDVSKSALDVYQQNLSLAVPTIGLQHIRAKSAEELNNIPEAKQQEDSNVIPVSVPYQEPLRNTGLSTGTAKRSDQPRTVSACPTTEKKPLKLYIPPRVDRLDRPLQRSTLLSEIAEVEETKDDLAPPCSTFPSNTTCLHGNTSPTPSYHSNNREHKYKKTGRRSNKRRSLSLPTGTLAFGDARIVYKNGHFTIETMDGSEIDSTRPPDKLDRHLSQNQVNEMHVSPTTNSPGEVIKSHSRETTPRKKTESREARPLMKRQCARTILIKNDSMANGGDVDVFYNDLNDIENISPNSKHGGKSDDQRVPRMGQPYHESLNESNSSRASETSSHMSFGSSISDTTDMDIDSESQNDKEKVHHTTSSSSLPETSDPEVKRATQRAKRTSSFRQAQEGGSMRLSGIEEDKDHDISRRRTASLDESQNSDINKVSLANQQNSTFFQKVMAKKKTLNDNLNMSSFAKQSESAKEFFSKKMTLKGLFKKTRPDSSGGNPMRMQHPVSPPIAAFQGDDDIGSVDGSTPPSSPYSSNRDFRRRHTSADLYAKSFAEATTSNDTGSNCPTPTQERSNFARQSASTPSTPSHESVSIMSFNSSTNPLRDEDQMSITSASSTTSSLQSVQSPHAEQPHKPKTPKPIGASPRRNPSVGSQISRTSSLPRTHKRERNRSLTSLGSEGTENGSQDFICCECGNRAQAGTMVTSSRQRKYSDHKGSSDSLTMCQFCRNLLDYEHVEFGDSETFEKVRKQSSKSDDVDSASYGKNSTSRSSFEKLGIISQTDVMSSNSNDSGIQRDAGVNSSNESIKGTPEGQIKFRRKKSTSPQPERPKSEVGVRWADLDSGEFDLEPTPVRLRHQGRGRPRPKSDLEDNIQLFDELFEEVLEDFDTEGSSFLSDRMKAFGSEIDLQPYCSLRNLYEMRRRDMDKQKNRRMSTPHPIKSRLQRAPRKLQKQLPLVRSSSMPESLEKCHKRRKLHHLLDFHLDSLSRHVDMDDCLSDDSDISFDHCSLQEKSISGQSSQSQLNEEEDNLTFAEALWDHITMDPEELGFRAQDVIEVFDMSDKDWWFGGIEEREGWFPAAFVRLRVNQDQLEDELDLDVTLQENLTTSPKLRRISMLNKNQARTNVVNEIINAEREYVKHLKDVVEGYIQHARKRKEMFSQDRIELIFGNLEVIYTFAGKFLDQLEMCMDVCPHLSEIGQCFLDNERGFEIYSDYCNNHPSACEELKELCQNSKYKHFFEACRLLKELVEIPLEGFLLTPVQKICKYPLQLAELLKYTPTDHPDYNKVKDALMGMRKIATLINERKRKMESIEKIAAWQHSVVDWEDADLLERSSELIFSGELSKINTAGWSQERYFFLFDHQLIYCKKELLKRHVFSYKGRIDLDQCNIVDVPDGKDTQYNVTVKHAWKLHETVKDKWYLVYAKTRAVKERWLKAIQDERKRVQEDKENDFCVPDHWKQTVLNKVRSQSNIKDKHQGSRGPHTTHHGYNKDLKDFTYSTIPRNRGNSQKSDKKKGWSLFGGSKKTKR